MKKKAMNTCVTCVSWDEILASLSQYDGILTLGIYVDGKVHDEKLFFWNKDHGYEFSFITNEKKEVGSTEMHLAIVNALEIDIEKKKEEISKLN